MDSVSCYVTVKVPSPGPHWAQARYPRLGHAGDARHEGQVKVLPFPLNEARRVAPGPVGRATGRVIFAPRGHGRRDSDLVLLPGCRTVPRARTLQSRAMAGRSAWAHIDRDQRLRRRRHFCLGYHMAWVEAVQFMVALMRRLHQSGKRLEMTSLPGEVYFPNPVPAPEGHALRPQARPLMAAR